MIPVNGASIGGRAVSAAMSHYVAIQLASVLAPGLVITTEAGLLVARLVSSTQNSDLAELTKALSSVRGSVVLIAVVVAVATSYIFGYVCRELGFWLEGRLEARRAKHNKNKKVVSAHPKRGAVEPSLHDLPHLARARALSGTHVVDDCIVHHPILGMLEDDDGLAAVAGRASRRHWTEYVPDREDAAFHYSKMWLRRHVPELSVDQTEAEINILVAMVVPVILLGVIVVAWSPSTWLAALIAVPAVATIVTVLTRQAARLRRGERWDAIRNLIFDHMMRTALSRYPGSAASLVEPAMLEAEIEPEEAS